MSHKKISLPLTGLLQALGIAVYTGLVAAFMWNMEKTTFQPNGVIGVMMMLFLLVFSAAICGLLFFGRSIYLAFDKQTKEAAVLLGYTFLFSIIIFTIILLTVAL